VHVPWRFLHRRLRLRQVSEPESTELTNFRFLRRSWTPPADTRRGPHGHSRLAERSWKLMSVIISSAQLPFRWIQEEVGSCSQVSAPPRLESAVSLRAVSDTKKDTAVPYEIRLELSYDATSVSWQCRNW